MFDLRSLLLQCFCLGCILGCVRCREARLYVLVVSMLFNYLCCSEFNVNGLLFCLLGKFGNTYSIDYVRRMLLGSRL